MDFNQLAQMLSDLPQCTQMSDEINCFKPLHHLMAQLSQERQTLSPEADQTEIRRFRGQLFPLVQQSTFCKYVYDKPRGYAGDYITQEMIWLGRTLKGKYLYDGVSRTGELINAFTFDMDNCKANEERVSRLQQYIHNAGPRLMSIGCGSCIELWNLPDDPEKFRKIVLVDQDEGALSRAREKLDGKSGLSCTYHQANVLKYILGKEHMQCGPRDLVYLFGLMDYFPLKSAKKLIQIIWPCVVSGGLLVVTNAHPSNSTKMWMEYVGDWFLDYKTEEMMYEMADGLPGIVSVELMTDDQGVYQYLELRAG